MKGPLYQYALVPEEKGATGVTEEVKHVVQRKDYNKIKIMLHREWADAKLLIDKRLEEIVGKLGEDGLPDVVRFLVSGGKRFRGFLTILISKAFDGEESIHRAVDAAVAIELVQAATLAIDDIIDGDEYRRGKISAWKKFGIDRTVLVSLLVIPVAQKIVESLGFKALYHVIRAWEKTVRGEIKEIILAKKHSPDKYIDVVKLKTAELFSLATLLGALSAGVKDDRILEKVSRYGELLGIVYQVADDLADYTIKKRSDKQLGPGEVLFEKWASSLDPENPAEAAKDFLRQRIIEIVTITRTLPITRKDIQQLLETLPIFMIKKLLEEAGLDHNNIFTIH